MSEVQSVAATGELARWRFWSARADAPGAVDSFVDHLRNHPPSGWRLLPPESLDPYRDADRSAVAWFTTEPSPAPVWLALSTRPAGVVRGGPVRVQTLADIPAAEDAVARFYAEGVRPAAARFGVEILVETESDRFVSMLPYETRRGLFAFDEAGPRRLPLDRDRGRAWHLFIIAAHREGDRFTDTGLADWLESRGWSNADAADLARRYVEDSRLLASFAESA